MYRFENRKLNSHRRSSFRVRVHFSTTATRRRCGITFINVYIEFPSTAFAFENSSLRSPRPAGGSFAEHSKHFAQSTFPSTGTRSVNKTCSRYYRSGFASVGMFTFRPTLRRTKRVRRFFSRGRNISSDKVRKRYIITLWN